MMTKDDIQRARKIINASTPGPWHVGHVNEALDRAEIENQDGIIIASDCRRNDEPLICAAREGWTQALDEIERLQSIVECPALLLNDVDKLRAFWAKHQYIEFEHKDENTKLRAIAEAAEIFYKCEASRDESYIPAWRKFGEALKAWRGE